MCSAWSNLCLNPLITAENALWVFKILASMFSITSAVEMDARVPWQQQVTCLWMQILTWSMKSLFKTTRPCAESSVWLTSHYEHWNLVMSVKWMHYLFKSPWYLEPSQCWPNSYATALKVPSVSQNLYSWICPGRFSVPWPLFRLYYHSLNSDGQFL